MSQTRTYRSLNRILREEALEPTLNWGLRLAVVLVAPLVWGSITGHFHEAIWISLTAESIAFVELKGTIGTRFRVLLAGMLISICFTWLGSVTGRSLWMSLAAMLVVGYLSSAMKSLGDRSSGLSLCIYLLFIISNAAPAAGAQLFERMTLVFAGGIWSLIAGMAASSFIPKQQPFRRSVAVIWKSVCSLCAGMARGWDNREKRTGLRGIYLLEKQVRASIDASISFHESLSAQTAKDHEDYSVVQIRRATSIIATLLTAVSEELEALERLPRDGRMNLKVYYLLKSLESLAGRMSSFVLDPRAEERWIVQHRIERVLRLSRLLQAYPGPEAARQTIAVITRSTERICRLADSILGQLGDRKKERPAYRSYSFLKTVHAVHPDHLVRNLRTLTSLNGQSVRFSIRTALAATLAMFLYKAFSIEHGYWLAFTVLIVMQPYFNATYQKARDRVIGTVAGVLLGALSYRFLQDLHLRELMLFVCSVLTIYFLRRRYAVAAFFITLSLILLLSVEGAFDLHLLVVRTLCTLGGAVIGITAGFLLLPVWDRKLLPHYVDRAIRQNFAYFLYSFSEDRSQSWTRMKRNAEIANSELFDSYTRFLSEPKTDKKMHLAYYNLFLHLMRITHELNNLNLEQEESIAKEALPAELAKELRECWAPLVAEEAAQFPEQLLLNPKQRYYFDRLLIELKSLKWRSHPGEGAARVNGEQYG